MSIGNDKYSDMVDENLIQLVLDGNRGALDSLINRHKDWIYNIALRMTGNTYEAEDVSQEIIIKIITKLSTFKFKSSFRTWLYRITANHVVNMKKYGMERILTSFDNHQELLESLQDAELGDRYSVDSHLLIEEMKIECMMGMLLCLNREQRIVFILGGIFGIDSRAGSVILGISEVNFRKKLSRARQELKNYMNDQCSLINENNKCKCSKKTKAAIEAGYVNPKNLQFHARHMKRVKEVVIDNKATVDDIIELRCQDLYREHPYLILESSAFLSIALNNDDRIFN